MFRTGAKGWDKRRQGCGVQWMCMPDTQNANSVRQGAPGFVASAATVDWLPHPPSSRTSRARTSASRKGQCGSRRFSMIRPITPRSSIWSACAGCWHASPARPSNSNYNLGQYHPKNKKIDRDDQMVSGCLLWARRRPLKHMRAALQRNCQVWNRGMT